MQKLLLLFLLAFIIFSCSPDSESTTEQSSDTDSTAAAPVEMPERADTAPETNPIDIDTSHFEYKNGALRLTWKMLSDVVFTDEYSEEVQAYVPYPTFGAQLQAIEGREVLVEGYVIPLEETGDETILVLSAQPYSSCFFCGGAGPESVMDIKLRPGEGQKFTTDDRMAFRGKLRLNDDDLYFLNYILEDAVVAPR